MLTLLLARKTSKRLDETVSRRAVGASCCIPESKPHRLMCLSEIISSDLSVVADLIKDVLCSIVAVWLL